MAIIGPLPVFQDLSKPIRDLADMAILQGKSPQACN
jgi:hypothetical protein